MGKFVDLTGKQYGRLTVLKLIPPEGGRTYWYCKCSCGKTTATRADSLLDGRSQSCGCLQREGVAQWARKHGHCVGINEGKHVSREYTTYYSMLWRCYEPKQKYYKNYGGRGIKVCARWRKSFQNFLSDMGPRPPGMTLHRKDNDGNYTPKNCCWATRKEQMRHSRASRILEYDGKKKSVPEWAEQLSLPGQVIHSRLFGGWSVERALSTPYVRGDRWATRRSKNIVGDVDLV